MISITPAQSALLHFLGTAPVSPTFRDMRAALGVKSNHTIHGLLDGLEERGWIRRLRGKDRGVEVLRTIPAPYRHRSTAERRAEARAWRLQWKPHFDALYGSDAAAPAA